MSDKYCVLQDDAKDCGVCSLLSIIKYYDGNVSREYLRELTNTTSDGVSALNLLKSSRELGFESYGIKGKLSDLNNQILPAIAHVIIDKKFPHFVVVYYINFKKNQVLIMDPAHGFLTYSINDFINISTNYYLVMKPKRKIVYLPNNNNYIDKIKNIVVNYKLVLINVVFTSLFYMIFCIIESYQFKLFYEESDIQIILFLLIIFILIRYFLSYLRNSLINMFNIKLDKTLIKDAFYHIINLPYLYYRNHTNGDLLTRINDLGNIKSLFSNLFVSIFVDLLLAIIVLVFMIKISLTLSLIIFVSLILYGLVVLIDEKKLKKLIYKNYKEVAIVNNYLVETLTSFETIKNNSLQKYVYKIFSQKYNSYSDNSLLLLKCINIESFFKSIFISIGNLLVVYLGIKMIENNSIKLSSLISFISLSNYLEEPIKNILNLHVEYQNVKESIKRIREIYQIPKEKFTNNGIDYLTGSINILNLSYSYNGFYNIISNTSFSIEEGEKVLLSGPSGCGKSTLIKLLIKYLDNNYKGNITIGGYDLKDIDIFSLRNNICFISQNEYLYTDSVYENITLGKRVKYSEFLNIAKNTYVDEIVHNSVLGFNYVIENNGENISGGERARIIIARALFKKASIYIFDETFNEIDINKERKILEYIFKIYPSKTIIIISHRLSNKDLFDKTIIMKGGKCEFIK